VRRVTTDFNADAVVTDVTEHLTRKYPGLDQAEIEAIVRDEVRSLQDRPVQDYVAVLAQRAANKRLKSR
jgi:hypothetical protein